jgi:hypothetical protein
MHHLNLDFNLNINIQIKVDLLKNIFKVYTEQILQDHLSVVLQILLPDKYGYTLRVTAFFSNLIVVYCTLQY